MKAAHNLLLAAALGALLAGCASKPRPAPAPATQPPPAASGDVPPSTAPQGQSPAYASLQAELAATAGDRIYFALDSDLVDAEAREILRRQADWLRPRADARVRIEGNADERGTREYNLALGARRAAAARQALIGFGVPAGRIDTISYGKERPIDPGSGEEAWARNRNAHTVLIGLGER